MTLLHFLALFSEFKAASWAAWRTILARLTPAVRELYAVAGRGSGKSRIVALLACWYATREYHRAPGESVYIGVFAPDRRQAQITFRYVVGLLRSVPALAGLIVAERADSVELSTGTVVEVITASTAAPRGRAYALAIVEEAAFLPTDESADPDVELLRSLRPALARVPGSLLAVVSSPYARRGVLFDAAQRYRESAPDHVLFVQAPTLDLNPTFDAAAIERAYLEDPQAAAAEYGAEFRADVESFVTVEAVDAAIVPGRVELPPTPSTRYVAFCDPAGGAGGDSMTLAVASAGPGGRVVLSAIREERPPFSPDATCQDFANLLRRYRVAKVVGDRFGGTWPAERFAAHGITYVPSAQPKSEIYAACLPLLNSRRVELLDNRRLRAQLIGLERRTARGGRDSIDHAPRAHDDVVNAVAGAIVEVLASARARRNVGTFNAWTGEVISGFDADGLEWREGRPWNGLFPPAFDSKGRPVGHYSEFVDGRFVGYQVAKAKEES